MHLAIRFRIHLIPVFLVAAGLIVGVPAMAQQTSGSISGVVHDAQGAVIPGAKIVIINQEQGSTVRELETSADGTFTVTPLIPATYTVEVEIAGFKKYVKKDIKLFAQDRIGLPPIVLEIGAITETVTVESSSVVLQTVSAERSGVVTSTQIVDLSSSGRTFTDFLKTIPGFNSDTQNANGLRSDQNAIAVDGVSVMDSGNNGVGGWRVNPDIIAEFKVLTNGQQAEFGRAAGANITAVTKGGTRDLHGGAYIFLKNEWTNANTWRNNYDHLSRPKNRNRTQGFQVGGPVFIPGKFNTNRDKFFFFVNFEWQRPKQFDNPTYLLVPTEAERAGDFSATQESGKPVTIKDPVTGQPFLGNKIPSNRFNAYGVQIMNLLPKPNKTGDPTYNYTYQYLPGDTIDDRTFRFDYNISTKWRMYFRMIQNRRVRYQNGGLQGGTNLGLSPNYGETGALAVSVNLVTIISPTMTNEFNFGRSENWLPNSAQDDSLYLRKNNGIKLPLLYPNADPLGLAPDLTFDVSPAGYNPSLTINGFPYANANPTINWTDNLAKVFPKHAVKVGFFLEDSKKQQTAASIPQGRLDFSRDSASPVDTGWAYSNLLLGNYKSYDQASKYQVGNYHYRNIEWYAQDNWRVLPNLTLDYGMRFSIVLPVFEDGDLLAGFRMDKFDSKKQVALYQPFLVGGKRVAQNPITGQVAPAAMIGLIVPNYGDPFNGMIVGNQNGTPRGLVPSAGVLLGPRLGLAWQPFGASSKTVVRMGGGTFYERIQGNMIFQHVAYPPLVQTPKIYYGNLNDIASSSGTLGTLTNAGLSSEGKVPTVYNFNASLQHQLPLGILLDIGYVGSLTRHAVGRYPYNEAPYGSAWLPKNQDPTKCPNLATCNLNGDNAMPADFLRPYIGYVGNAGAPGAFGAAGYVATFGSSSNYHSMQISLNRRMAKKLQAGLVYTWGKAMGTDTSYNSVANPLNHRKADYALLDFDRTQVLTINYVYNLPAAAKGFLDNPVGRMIFNNWQVTGITSFSSGAPATVSYSVQGVATATLQRRITGSEGLSARPILTGNINKSGGNRTLEAWINTSVIQPAVRPSVQMESALRPLRQPGINNWDMSFFKKVPLGKSEVRYLQLRLEMYNAFNHTQWSAVNSAAQFDANGKLVNLPTSLGGSGGRFGFGALSTARGPRTMQGALKFYF